LPSSFTILAICTFFSVRARIVSFGDILAVPWKSYLVLDCLHVGEPAPSIQWQHDGAAIQENSKYQVIILQNAIGKAANTSLCVGRSQEKLYKFVLFFKLRFFVVITQR
jgi:hypothetical protein